MRRLRALWCRLFGHLAPERSVERGFFVREWRPPSPPIGGARIVTAQWRCARCGLTHRVSIDQRTSDVVLEATFVLDNAGYVR